MNRKIKKVCVLTTALVTLITSTMGVSAAGLRDVFDAQYYADSYADLKEVYGYDEEALYQHYLTYGINEGRTMSPILDVVKYREAYGDLDAAFGADWDAYVEHYLTYGIKEGRISGGTFDPVAYADAYPDVKAAYGDNYEAIIEHFLEYGMQEGRTAGVTLAVTEEVVAGARRVSAPAATQTPAAGTTTTSTSSSTPTPAPVAPVTTPTPAPVVPVTTPTPAPSFTVSLGTMQDNSIIKGDSIIIQVSTDVFNASFQWYTCDFDGGNKVKIEGADGNSYRVDSTNMSIGDYYYVCTVSVGGVTKDSDVSTVTVREDPIISNVHLISTTDVSVTEGSITGSIESTCTIKFGFLPKYTWYYSENDDLTNPTTVAVDTVNMLDIPRNLTAGTYYFYCTATTNGVVQPAQSTNKVKVIVAQSTPTAITVTLETSQVNGLIVGETGSIQVSTNALNPEYQWYTCDSQGTNKQAISGATKNTYDIDSTGMALGDYYYVCTVTSGNASQDSDVITVTVNPVMPPSMVNGVIKGETANIQVLDVPGSSYQWYTCDSQGTNKQAISGATENTYVIDSTNMAIGDYYYVCTVTSGNASQDSDVMTVTVNPDMQSPYVSNVYITSALEVNVIEENITNDTPDISATASKTPVTTLQYTWYYSKNANLTNSIEVEKNAVGALEIPRDLTVGTYYFYCTATAVGTTQTVQSTNSVKVIVAPKLSTNATL